MGFFKDFREDLNQAVNELIPDEVLDDEGTVNTLSDDSEENEDTVDVTDDMEEEITDKELLDAILTQEETTEDSAMNENSAEVKEDTSLKETEIMEENTLENYDNAEVTVISKSTVISGNIRSEGALEVIGTIKGDVECVGKLSVIGSVTGNLNAAEVYVGAKRMEGSINSKGNVKIGLGTVIIGDISATSGLIAGAVKGDVDIHGAVVIDSSAVVKGNIKAQSIQINNGAVIEGFCSLSYASIDIDNIFE